MMKLFYVTTEKGRSYKVHALGIDDAAWTVTVWIDDGDAVVRIELF
jgi:chlorite dismutase